MKKSILVAQLILGGMGIVFSFMAIMGQLQYTPRSMFGYGSTGAQPIVLLIIGLPMIAVTLILQGKHKEVS